MKTDHTDQSSVKNGREQLAGQTSRPVSWTIYGTIADTTWRMFVPVIGGTLLGYGADRLAGSRPAGVLTGMCLGIVTAIKLVVMQYRSVTRGRSNK